MLGTCQASRRV